MAVFADVDVVEGEEPAETIAGGAGTTVDEDALVKDATIKPHPDADTQFLMTKPAGGNSLELPAGKDVAFLVGFRNKGQQDFVVDAMEASFRYAMDFSFHLQNLSAIQYNRVVKPGEEATFAYSFFVSEAYSARPYGLTVNLHYRDPAGAPYLTAVFNETINVVELDEGLDGETLFLYLLLSALVALIGFTAYTYLLSSGSKRSAPRVIEAGTVNHKEVDYDWIPKNTLDSLTKSPKAPKSPKSPKTNKAKAS